MAKDLKSWRDAEQVHNESQGIQNYEAEESNNSSVAPQPPPAVCHFYHTKDDCLCIAEADKVDKVGHVHHYIAALLKIPSEKPLATRYLCAICFTKVRNKYLITYCKCMCGDFIEHRKHVFWRAQEHGLYPQARWQRTSILSAHTFFHRFSILGPYVNDYSRNLVKAVPRQPPVKICSLGHTCLG